MPTERFIARYDIIYLSSEGFADVLKSIYFLYRIDSSFCISVFAHCHSSRVVSSFSMRRSRKGIAAARTAALSPGAVCFWAIRNHWIGGEYTLSNSHFECTLPGAFWPSQYCRRSHRACCRQQKGSSQKTRLRRLASPGIFLYANTLYTVSMVGADTRPCKYCS